MPRLEVRFRQEWPGATLDIDFAAPWPGTTVLFGPSGAGKSSVVATVAGLARPTSAYVRVPGRVLADTARGVWVPPEKRRIGLVFQDARLFPHLGVMSNLRYGQRRAPMGPVAFDTVVAMLGLETLLDRRPTTLSGGEARRVAIGRALLAQPTVLLMDEPLAGLDAARQAEIVPYLLRLKALGIPILYVTHDVAEAARLADTLVLLAAGRVTAAGPIGEVGAWADTPFGSDAAASVLDGIARASGRDGTAVRAAGRDWVSADIGARPGAAARLLIRADDVALATGPVGMTSIRNVVPGTVAAMTREPNGVRVAVTFNGGGLLAWVTADSAARLDLATGRPVSVLVKASSVRVL